MPKKPDLDPQTEWRNRFGNAAKDSEHMSSESIARDLVVIGSDMADTQ